MQTWNSYWVHPSLHACRDWRPAWTNASPAFVNIRYNIERMLSVNGLIWQIGLLPFRVDWHLWVGVALHISICGISPSGVARNQFIYKLSKRELACISRYSCHHLLLASEFVFFLGVGWHLSIWLPSCLLASNYRIVQRKLPSHHHRSVASACTIAVIIIHHRLSAAYLGQH